MSDKYRINEDGSVDIKRKITTHVGPFETFYEIGEAFFPCMDVDGDSFFKLALTTGLVGGHKFYTGNFFQGLLYLMTFGLLGIGYILDLLLIIAGSYSFKGTRITEEGSNRVRTYARPVIDVKQSFIYMGIALILAVPIIGFVYWPLVSTVSELLGQVEMSIIS